MPRKFKCSVTVPGDNSIDVYTHDVSLVVITSSEGELEGFNILAGGGLGRTHNKEDTFPRAADPIGYVEKEDIYELLKAIVATQRDYGNRSSRRHARMKYLIHDWGVEKFRAQVEEYLGKPLAPFKSLPDWRYLDYLGWHDQGDGKKFLGIAIENGRVKDEGTFRLKTALRQIVQKYQIPLRLSANQNVILYEIAPADQEAIATLLAEHGIVTEPEALNPLDRYAMACPALPTCGLAITESERALPHILKRIQALLDKLGLGEESLVIRMTGCPNGCARPYMAELGFVGINPETYQIWLGGSPHQTRLAETFQEKLPLAELESFLEPLLLYFRTSRQKEESFGDFCHRVGSDALRNPPVSQGVNGRNRKNQNRVSVLDEMFVKLKEASLAENRPMNHIINEALEAYFSKKGES
jgi:sulfite reductase (ferredoxin)